MIDIGLRGCYIILDIHNLFAFHIYRLLCRKALMESYIDQNTVYSFNSDDLHKGRHNHESSYKSSKSRSSPF